MGIPQGISFPLLQKERAGPRYTDDAQTKHIRPTQLLAMPVFAKLLIFVAFLRPLAGIWSAFNATGKIPVYLGETVVFECLGPANHHVQLQEVGNPDTFEEQQKFYGGLPDYVTSLRYEPVNCNSTPSEGTTNCSKLVTMTVIADMNGKSYKCRSFNIFTNIQIFSDEGTIEVRDFVTSSGGAVRPTETMRVPTPTSARKTPTPSSTTTSTTTFPTANPSPTAGI
jgi:hypothetical protein